MKSSTVKNNINHRACPVTYRRHYYDNNRPACINRGNNIIRRHRLVYLIASNSRNFGAPGSDQISCRNVYQCLHMAMRCVRSCQRP